MSEIDQDKSGTVDFFEFLSVARLVTQQKGWFKYVFLKFKNSKTNEKLLAYET